MDDLTRTSVASEPAVRAYLEDLERALGAIPASERAAVTEGVLDHILSAGGANGHLDRRRLHEVLEELGDPAAIAEESGANHEHRLGEPQRPRFLERRAGGMLTVAALAFGGVVLPILGWFIGVVLLWSSRGWGVAQKLAGTLLLPGGFLSVVYLGAIVNWSVDPVTTSTVCEYPADGSVTPSTCEALNSTGQAGDEIGVLLVVVLMVVQVAASIYLAARFRDREAEATVS